jgi:serine O-acetyltransferase
MKSILTNLYRVLQTIRTAPHLFLCRNSSVHVTITLDVGRWVSETIDHWPDYYRSWPALVTLLTLYPEFRNLFYYRLKQRAGTAQYVAIALAERVLRPMDTLTIATPDIGHGLFIQHGFATIIAARSIGDNCWINQQVTIGFSNTSDCPVIGDNVQIRAGAKVFGAINIGANSIVGANAVVTKSVPANCTVVGVPAYIIKRDGLRVREPLK